MWTDYPTVFSLIPTFISIISTSYLIFVVEILKIQWLLNLSKIILPWNFGIIIIGLTLICMVPSIKNDILDKDALLPFANLLSDYINKFSLSTKLASGILTAILQFIGYIIISSQMYNISSQIGNKIYSLFNEGIANLPWEIAMLVMLIVVVLGSFIFLFVINFKERLWDSRKKDANRIDGSHEWQTLNGERITSATRKDVYEKKHGYGSWDKKSTGIDSTLLIFAFIAPAILATLVTGFFVSMSLGLYIVIFLICELTLTVAIGLFDFINRIWINIKYRHPKK